MFSSLGSAPNAAVQKYLNDNKVPQLFVATGASALRRSGSFSLDDGLFSESYLTEGRIYGTLHSCKSSQIAKIGILYQNDDLGKDFVIGLKQVLGAKAASMIVAEAAYETTDPTVDSQIVRLKSAGADLFYTFDAEIRGAGDPQDCRKSAGSRFTFSLISSRSVGC